MFNRGFLLLALVLFKPCYAVSISTYSAGKYLEYKTITLNKEAGEGRFSTIVITLHTYDANDNAGWDIDSDSEYACQSPIANSLIQLSDAEFHNLGSCKIRTKEYKKHADTGVLMMDIKNDSYTEKKVYVDVVVWRYGTIHYHYQYTAIAPAASSCAATVNNLNLGSLISGSAPVTRTLPFSISGGTHVQSLVISGSDIQSDGTLNLGGSTSGVKVYPASRYISGSTWNAGSSSGSIPLTVDASAGRAGTWTSSLLATLTCS